MLILALGAIFMLAISIFVHELGHLLCGKLVGVKARIFSIGYGKGIWKKKIGETTYQITAFPIGGYVMFKGDEYGKKLKGEPGELLSTPPLKRMVPVLGGPFANLLLGFILLFILELTGNDTPSNKIFIDPVIESTSPAYKAGLRSGDVITQINGRKVENFEDIFTAISLSKGEPLWIEYWEGGNPSLAKKVRVLPNLYSKGGRPSIGIEPAGERRVVANFSYSEQISEWLETKLGKREEAEQYFQDQIKEKVEKGELSPKALEDWEKNVKNQKFTSRAIRFLKDGDIILSVNGVEVYTVTDLQKELGKYRNKTVTLKVIRKKIPLLNPWSKEIVNIQAPVVGGDIIVFKNLKHSQFSEWNYEELSLASYDPDLEQKLSRMKINGKSYQSLQDIIQFIQKQPNQQIELSLRDEIYTAKIEWRPIGLLGFRPSIKFHPETQVKEQSIGQALVGSIEKVYENVSVTLKGIGMLFSGFLSPKENLSGPIGIVHFAGLSLEYGWRTYLDFVAKISIALMIMNLLPIPVADGGHIVMYAYEAIAGRPLPKKVIEFIFRLGLLFLLGLFIFVSFHDALRFF